MPWLGATQERTLSTANCDVTLLHIPGLHREWVLLNRPPAANVKIKDTSTALGAPVPAEWWLSFSLHQHGSKGQPPENASHTSQLTRYMQPLSIPKASAAHNHHNRRHHQQQHHMPSASPPTRTRAEQCPKR